MTPMEFEEKNLQVFKDVQSLEVQIKQLQEQEKDMKSALVKAMEENNIKSLDNDFVKVTYVEPTESHTTDWKAFKEREPDVYESISKDYPKVVKRKGYVRVTVK